jgi:uncharacterized tellurite resistance protein B-like protein
MGLLSFLGWYGASTPRGSAEEETETVRKIAAALERLPPDHARYLAAFAYLLSRVANADMEISGEETRAMERIVAERGDLPEEQAVLIVHMAKSQNTLFGGVENFLVTREFHRIATHEQKIALLHCLYAVSSADRSVSVVEDATIRQIASELFLDHREFVAVRHAYRDFLAVLKEPGDLK